MASGEAQLSSSNDPQYDTGLTLRRLEVWTEEWKLRMRMMSACVESCRDSKGGALVSEIHKYTDNGDPFIRHFTDQLLEEVSKPFFVTLHRWIYSGELHDPFDEFFVAVDPALAGLHHAAGASYDVDDRTRESGLNLWTSKYTFREEMLPRFVGREFGRKIFSTGKSLNFIRYSCQDSEWVATRNKISTTGKVLKYSDIAGLERTIDSAYQIASQRLFDVFFEKFKLMDHLAALKNYLLLGHGDFAEHLMETLAPNLSKPANSLQRHKLTSSLETAIRATNAQFDPPDVLRRLDARMLEFTHGEIGWDVFTLEYKVDSPIDTVLDPDSMKKYLRIFGHLWRLKRVDAALTACWMRITSGSRAFLRVPSLAKHWHQVRIAMSEMIFFVRQFQTYVHLVVVEDCWNELQEFLKKKEGDLDSLIQAHRQYLQRVTTRILLLRNRQGKEEQYLGQVREALEFALQFVEAVDSLYNYSLSEAARIDMGVYTNASAREGRRTPESDTLLRTLHRIKEYSVKFSDRAVHVAIPIQAHDDPKCKVLGHILAFSDFYPNKRQRMREEQGTSSEIRQF
ncbi:Microtubule-nucleating Tub4p (gamma-tubulin) complex component [Tulasnella sp. 403]|nr:Microtubule-nucleating Tub4p (gamma-tubulin) complex component [Tulasnella sp. 403]